MVTQEEYAKTMKLTGLQQVALTRLIDEKTVNWNRVSGVELRSFNGLVKKGVARLDY